MFWSSCDSVTGVAAAPIFALAEAASFPEESSQRVKLSFKIKHIRRYVTTLLCVLYIKHKTFYTLNSLNSSVNPILHSVRIYRHLPFLIYLLGVRKTSPKACHPLGLTKHCLTIWEHMTISVPYICLMPFHFIIDGVDVIYMQVITFYT